jgi:hypothetical protein
MPVNDPNNVNRNLNAPGNRGWGYGPDAAWGCVGWAFLWIFLIIIFFAGWGWWGWGRWGWNGNYNNQAYRGPQNNQPYVAPNTGAAPQRGGENMRQALPNELVGAQVTMTGKVDQVFNDQAFTFKADGNNHDILVVATKAGTPHPKPKQGDTVQVKGKIQQFDQTRFHDESKADLNHNNLAQYRDHPAILASSVTEQSHAAE